MARKEGTPETTQASQVIGQSRHEREQQMRIERDFQTLQEKQQKQDKKEKGKTK